MEAWLRFEKWFAVGLVSVLILFLLYVNQTREIIPPVSGLGKPVQIRENRGFIQAVYVVEENYLHAMVNRHDRFRVAGFKVIPRYGVGHYRRDGLEYVRMFPGDTRYAPRQIGPPEFKDTRTTVVYSIRKSPWRGFWRRIQRDWAAKNQKPMTPATSYTIPRASP